MPKEIDCPECGKKGFMMQTTCSNNDCKDGKITVYTQAELNQAVKEAIEKCIKACEGFYTAADCIEAIQKGVKS